MPKQEFKPGSHIWETPHCTASPHPQTEGSQGSEEREDTIHAPGTYARSARDGQNPLGMGEMSASSWNPSKEWWKMFHHPFHPGLQISLIANHCPMRWSFPVGLACRGRDLRGQLLCGLTFSLVHWNFTYQRHMPQRVHMMIHAGARGKENIRTSILQLLISASLIYIFVYVSKST